MPSPTSLANGTSTQPRTLANIPITTQRTPFQNSKKNELQNAGEPRANLAPSVDTPNGTTANGWDKKHAHQSVLQQHCDFFDRDGDGKAMTLELEVWIGC
jgi:peroxygenase